FTYRTNTKPGRSRSTRASPSRTTASAAGWGCLSMRERASFSGGTCRIDSAPGRGTRIEVSWSCGQSPGNTQPGQASALFQ
ncbi:MAG TPA: hypothetical protein VKO83_00795, partial [Steroidobacteraceae bacterium]|nr:hypothetical protein [Steroidobacteraceae bacterium]